MYLLSPADRLPQGTQGKARAQLLASGVGVRWALEAQQLLADEWDVAADVWSVTSWSELRREGDAIERDRILDPALDAVPYVTRALADRPGPVLATSDYQRAVANQIAPWVPGGDYTALGADGFGFSDTRAAARRYFLIDGPSLVAATLAALERRGEYRAGAAAEAVTRYRLHDASAGTSGSAGGES
jgi:pyruvate dehydrogenase E1 component